MMMLDQVDKLKSANAEYSDTQIEMHGTVKWFDTSKGYGFIIPDVENIAEYDIAQNQDVMLHVNCFREQGMPSVSEGTKLRFIAEKRAKGLQAIKIVEFISDTKPDTKTDDLDTYKEVEVKWFDTSKGYGFVREKHDMPDIFIHIMTLRQIGLTGLKPGQKFLAQISTGHRGEYVAVIRNCELPIDSNQ